MEFANADLASAMVVQWFVCRGELRHATAYLYAGAHLWRSTTTRVAVHHLDLTKYPDKLVERCRGEKGDRVRTPVPLGVQDDATAPDRDRIVPQELREALELIVDRARRGSKPSIALHRAAAVRPTAEAWSHRRGPRIEVFEQGASLLIDHVADLAEILR